MFKIVLLILVLTGCAVNINNAALTALKLPLFTYSNNGISYFLGLGVLPYEDQYLTMVIVRIWPQQKINWSTNSVSWRSRAHDLY